MGKKAKTNSGKLKARGRKIDKTTLPPPPKPVDNEVGSAKLLDEPSLPGSGYKALDRDGFDDGGVADLTLVIDLEDNFMRRKRGETEYFSALKADLLPRVTRGPMAHMARRDQKIKLARLLFSDDENDEDKNPSEVYVDRGDAEGDEAIQKYRAERLASARMALSLSCVLREPACASLSLSELSKRRLASFGKAGAEAALRCADKAIEIAGEGFWDRDDIEIEVQEDPEIDPKYEKNATNPSLAHPTMLKLLPRRVSYLCLRAAYLHRGNALSALGRDEEACASYANVLPMLENEPRCGRLDWERNSLYVNIGNTWSRRANFEKADEYYDIGARLGKEHYAKVEANRIDGLGMMIVAMRARAFALKKDGREDEGKEVLRKVIEMQIEHDTLVEKKKEEEEAKQKEEEANQKQEEEAKQKEENEKAGEQLKNGDDAPKDC